MHEPTAPVTPLSYRILLALADGARHGYGIIKEIEEREGSARAPSTGAMYLALQRLEGEGLIAEAAAPSSEHDPRRRYYRLTRRGRVVAQTESSQLASLVEVARAKRLLPESGV